MKNNIKYFTRKAAWMWIISLVYGIVWALLSGDEGDAAVGYLCIGIFAGMHLGGQVTTLKNDVPLVLSFGSTRKNLFRGLLYLYGLECVLGTASIIVASVVTVGVEGKWGILLTVVIGGSLLAQCLGMFMGYAIYKFKGAMAFLTIFGVTVGISALITMCIIKFKAQIAEALLLGFAGPMPYIIIGASIALWLIMVAVMRKCVYRYVL